MTEDEIKGLTTGDNVYVRAMVLYVDKRGRECRVCVYGADDDEWAGYAKAEDMYRALPEKAVTNTKWAPFRRLRKGDRVQLVAQMRRKIARLSHGVVYEVKEDESDFGTVEVWTFEHETYELYPYGIFELVAPVEDLEPYSVQETMSHDGWQIVRDGLPLVIYDAQRHPNAKASAEAERDRLNSEYRKEVANG